MLVNSGMAGIGDRGGPLITGMGRMRGLGDRGFGRMRGLGDVITGPNPANLTQDQLAALSPAQLAMYQSVGWYTPTASQVAANYNAGPDAAITGPVTAAQIAGPSVNVPNTPPPPPPSALQFSFVNVTRGDNTSFRPGDSWRISITGAPPNQPVYVSGSQEGSAFQKVALGNTDSGGNFQTQGQMTADQIGNWSQIWFVGSQQITSFNFQVLQSPGPSGTQSSTPTDPTSTTTATTTAVPAGPVDTGIATPPVPAFLTALPTWAWIAGALGVGYFLMRGES